MSTLDPSTRRLPARGRELTGAVRTAVSGVAFWASIPLPLCIAAALLTGAVESAPFLVLGLVVLNVCCAALGQPYSPNR